MTAGTEARTLPGRRQKQSECGDRLVPFPEVARRLGRSAETLRPWRDGGHCPAVVSPGGQWSTYESFISAVLAWARPRQAGSIEQIAHHWFAAHNSERVA